MKLRPGTFDYDATKIKLRKTFRQLTSDEIMLSIFSVYLENATGALSSNIVGFKKKFKLICPNTFNELMSLGQ